MYLLEIKKKRDCRTRSILKMIFPEARNVICYDLHANTRLSSGCRNYHSEFKAIFNNFLVIRDMVASDESDHVHRLTQNTRNAQGVF